MGPLRKGRFAEKSPNLGVEVRRRLDPKARTELVAHLPLGGDAVEQHRALARVVLDQLGKGGAPRQTYALEARDLLRRHSWRALKSIPR